MRLRSLWTTCLVLALFATSAHAQAAQNPPKPKRAVVVTGENSYNGHVWKDTSVELKNILDAGKSFAEVKIEPDPNFIADPAFLTYDVAVFDFRNANPLAMEAQVEANLLKFLSQGRGLVVIHWANGAFPYWPEYVNIVGRAQQSVHDRRGPFTVKISNPNHPITRGMTDYQTDDELFWDTKEGNKTIVPVAMAQSNVHYQDFPMALTLLYTSGRVFTTTMGHDVRALQVPGTTQLIQRGAAWVAKLIN